MRRNLRLPLIGFVTLLLVSGFAASIATTSHAAVPMSPHAVRTAGAPVPLALPHRAAAPATASAHAASAAASPQPASGPCNTPGGSPSWQTSNFFSDAIVSFWTPGSPDLSGSNFQTEPCPNIIPTYTNGFVMNVTTSVPLTLAIVTIWGTTWPTPGAVSNEMKGFTPTTPTQLNMYIEPPFHNKATFYFNDYRYFWPGSQVYFNVTLGSTNASPSTIYSADRNGGKWAPFYTNGGGQDNYTWSFYVASPFSERQGPGSTPVNFSNVIDVTTTPTVLTTPSFEPNPKQSLQITISARNQSGVGVAIPIPMAQAQFTITGGTIGQGVYYQNFGPANHTVMQLAVPLGPYPGASVRFNITAWLPWEGGGIDFIYSTVYSFNWSAYGGWLNPNGGLEANIHMSTLPDLTLLGTAPTLPTGTPLNVSIHESVQNVTIGSASVHFRYADGNGVTYGDLPMTAANPNTSFAVFPGLPPNSGLQFSVIAKDIFGNPITSGNWSYAESGPIGSLIQDGYGLFFFETIDLSTGLLVPNVNFTVANDTWSETTNGYALGFANPVPVAGHGFLPVAIGTYVVTVRAFGQSQTWTGTVTGQDPFVVVFYLTSQPVTATYTAPLPGLTIGAAVGLLAAAIAFIPISNWFRERRRKAEAEQRRISL